MSFDEQHDPLEDAMKFIDKQTKQLENWREMGLMLWCQFAHYRDAEGRDRYSNMALSALEDLEDALLRLNLIDKRGQPIAAFVNPNAGKIEVGGEK